MICYNDNENTLFDCLQSVESFDFFKNSNIQKIDKNNFQFLELKRKIEQFFLNSRLMPAFGVSLHKETQDALKSDEWLKINFNQTLVKNGLPFNALLFKLEETKGFNLIRLFDGKYEGRCLFLDLDDTINLKDIVNNLQQK